MIRLDLGGTQVALQLRVLFPPVFQGSIVGGGFLLPVCSSVPIVMISHQCVCSVSWAISPLLPGINVKMRLSSHNSLVFYIT